MLFWRTDRLIDLLISQDRIRELTGIVGTHAGGRSHEKDSPISGILKNQDPHRSTVLFACNLLYYHLSLLLLYHIDFYLSMAFLSILY